jgi:hypothetical protein
LTLRPDSFNLPVIVSNSASMFWNKSLNDLFNYLAVIKMKSYFSKGPLNDVLRTYKVSVISLLS